MIVMMTTIKNTTASPLDGIAQMRQAESNKIVLCYEKETMKQYVECTLVIANACNMYISCPITISN